MADLPPSLRPSLPTSLPTLPPAPVGHYRHYKGNEYALIGVVRHSETLQPLVLYRPLYGDGALWVRPYAMFFESVTVDGVLQPRFARLPDPASPADQTSN